MCRLPSRPPNVKPPPIASMRRRPAIGFLRIKRRRNVRFHQRKKSRLADIVFNSVCWTGSDAHATPYALVFLEVWLPIHLGNGRQTARAHPDTCPAFGSLMRDATVLANTHLPQPRHLCRQLESSRFACHNARIVFAHITRSSIWREHRRPGPHTAPLAEQKNRGMRTRFDTCITTSATHEKLGFGYCAWRSAFFAQCVGQPSHDTFLSNVNNCRNEASKPLATRLLSHHMRPMRMFMSKCINHRPQADNAIMRTSMGTAARAAARF